VRERLLAISALLVVTAACNAIADCPDNSDCPAGTVTVVVHEDRVLRQQDLGDFFSINLNHYRFERDLLKSDGTVSKSPIETLKALPDVYYRYPGGLVSNSYDWESATGPVATRPPRASVRHAAAAPVRFGIDEYLSFVEQTGGNAWYVLNLLGWSSAEADVELPLDQVTASNARLAQYLHEHYDAPLYLQLGNELDRAVYQWPVEKYLARSRATMDAMRNELPDATFVAFLRDFDWTYKGKKDPRAGTKSRYQDFIASVLDGLPDVNDFSLHFYYDDPGLDKRTKRIGWRLKQIESAIDAARRARKGNAPTVWITEHARGVNLEAGKGMQRAALTSNLSATISTGDFLIGLSQIPEVRGAFWHGLNAGPWQLFDATIEHRDLRPRPVYWGYRVLRSVLLEQTLATQITSGQGDDDVRATGFRSADGSTFGLWAANRRDEAIRLAVRYAPYAGNEVTVRRFEIRGPVGADPDDPAIDPLVVLEPDAAVLQFSDDGTVNLVISPLSVSAFEIRR
jgi:hypothetical protein